MTEIVFFTSSRVKLAHAIYLCRDFDVRIVGFREKTFGASYVEPRIYDRDELIHRSYQDALLRWQKTVSVERLFFIEDTSVVISALSSERETPGLDIKYWMKDMTFERLDSLLRAQGNDRTVTVRSDLVLHLPPDLSFAEPKTYKRFTSTVSGRIVDREENFETNPTYPWLDNVSFNKWFAPEECTVPISVLPIRKADPYDFRAGAFKEMLSFLEQRRKIQRRLDPEIQTNLDLGPTSPQLFIVCGPTCAGKTTLAEYLAERYGYYHLEASDFMYRAYYRRHGTSSSVPIGDFAAEILKEEPEIVAKQILDNLSVHSLLPIVVTGFRSEKEIEWFRRHYAGGCDIEVVYVSADQSIRMTRALARARDDERGGWEDFLKRDYQQSAMGLTEMEARYSGSTLRNNESLAVYFGAFERRYLPAARIGSIKPIQMNASVERLEDLILFAMLRKTDGKIFLTTTQIADVINQLNLTSAKSKNNISRYFNQLFYPYFEIQVFRGKRRYRLSNTGRGKARLVAAVFETGVRDS